MNEAGNGMWVLEGKMPWNNKCSLTNFMAIIYSLFALYNTPPEVGIISPV